MGFKKASQNNQVHDGDDEAVLMHDGDGEVSALPGILLVLLLLAGLVWSLASPKRSFSENENRVLAQAPTLNGKDVLSGEYMKDYETYLSDQFPGRDDWILLKTRCEMALGKLDSNGVYFGAEGYLLETHEDVDETKAYANAEAVINYASRKSLELGKDHVRVLIAPTATNILSEKLPEHATYWDENRYLTYIATELAASSMDPEIFVDVRDILNSHDEEYIYYRTDHHWTTLGAFYGYCRYLESFGNQEALPPANTKSADGLGGAPAPDGLSANLASYGLTLKTVSEDFYGTIYSKIGYCKEPDTIQVVQGIFGEDGMPPVTVTLDQGTQTLDSLYVEEHLSTKDQYAYFLDGNHPLEVIQVTGGSEKVLLVIKDSYAHTFVPYLTRDYGTIVMVDLRYYHGRLSDLYETYQVTDVLMLYHAAGLATDNSLELLGW